MGVQLGASRKPLVSVEPVGPAGGEFWAIVLAGGEGMRLRALTDRICADRRPKQYVPLFGGRSLLDQTLDRVGLVVPRTRTAVVTLRSHSRYFFGQFAATGSPHVLVQPADRGTAAGILFPAQWVAWRDPEASVRIWEIRRFWEKPSADMARSWAARGASCTWSGRSGRPRRGL